MKAKKVCLLVVFGCMLCAGCKTGENAVQSLTPEKVNGVEGVQSSQVASLEGASEQEKGAPEQEKGAPEQEKGAPGQEKGAPEQEKGVTEQDSRQELPQVNDPTQNRDAADAAAYIGEYTDVDGGPGLEIAAGDNGNYVVQIGIVGLTVLDDGVGVLSGSGMEFTATDAAGNPIKGLITLKGTGATVTFTDSTWELIANGDYYEYTKSSDTPNIQ